MGALPGLRLTAVSPLVETEPVGGPPQGDYLNAVVLGECELSPWRLLPACQRIESAAGRQRRERWGPRTLDIDIIDVGNRRQDHPRLQLPHPRAGERAFVLVPWSLAAPDATLAGRPVAELRELAPDRGGVRVWQGDPDWVAAE
ncbi:MAG: 2-amino-4-hydroxy-6-hydroxymethyldihydropteridine diphosphokinase [Micrococcales bacterium]|nr:MAG: 2-amino-4-hydroxy-6-hydroxymethyldihydropteridine diphosphokinase [Micrococcales bacterium]